MTLPIHQFATLLPMIAGAEFDDFVEDIRVNGVRDAIDILGGAVLDGRTRYFALQRLCDVGAPLGPGWGVYGGAPLDPEMLIPEDWPWFKVYVPELSGDPLDYVISKNLKRRHLNDDQRRMFAAKVANMGRGRPELNPAECGIKVADAARMVNVDEAGTERARTVLARASEPIQRAVENGHLTVNAAAQAAKLDPETQSRIAEQATAGAANAVKTAIKQGTRAVRERVLGARQLADPVGRFGVIFEDFEWDYVVRSRDTGMDRHAANHYETAEDAHTPAEIVARTAGRFSGADDDCVLFMCATVPHLAIAIHVLELRGFRYVSHYALPKPYITTGWWSRVNHELLLIGVKGRPPCPARGTQWDSVLENLTWSGEHSAKPPEIFEMINAYYPTMPKLELNARAERDGWTCWGNQMPAGPAVDAAGEPLAFNTVDGEIEPDPAPTVALLPDVVNSPRDSLVGNAGPAA